MSLMKWEAPFKGRRYLSQSQQREKSLYIYLSINYTFTWGGLSAFRHASFVGNKLREVVPLMKTPQNAGKG